MPTTVVNIRETDRTTPGVYIGRERNGFHFGNPFSHKFDTLAAKVVKSREEAIGAFRQWLKGEAYPEIEPERRQWILSNLEQLRGKQLRCYCKPAACHGDVYVELLDS